MLFSMNRKEGGSRSSQICLLGFTAASYRRATNSGGAGIVLRWEKNGNRDSGEKERGVSWRSIVGWGIWDG
ncbi:unnamed protein product [Cuscuta campestris]|uniref:Uncharacterized protein n=1 Tax=Cuscuta campestris TaxID=132261 RepID=A0A484NH70_9ASTE|nr:unnamed protein product [Cuscuta campestris]